MNLTTSLAGLCGAILLATLSVAGPQATPKKLRVGTYDSRAVAVAYAASSYNPVGEKMAEMRKAKAANDTARIAELEAWGAKHQRQLHRQGFGHVPVDDLLAHVKAKRPDAAAKAGVDVIVFDCDYASAEVEVVDVTDALVALYDPSQKTLDTVAEMKKHAPIELDEIEQMKD